ncbi:TIM barrel protein [Candidatus Pacearchaeota archaeon]|nr:TIM barrel protein [Candidatus Pacearchaeota archaeon]MBD3282988.1 TIM barrel protein [Candidatus Pacearchaeota archaeon]
MKIGVKTYNSEEFLKNFKKTADFFEIQAIETNKYDFLKKFKKPIIIHAQHSGNGINNANKKLYDKNLKSAKFAINLANHINAKKIIFHAGIIEKDCTEKQAIKFLKNLKDKRILIENSAGYRKVLCRFPEETKNFLEKTNKGFCFDINHAIVTANHLKKNHINFIREFLKLKPVHFHIGGQDINAKIDQHKSFRESNINLREILSLLPEDSEITLEVTTDIEKTKEDLNIIKKIIEQLRYL